MNKKRLLKLADLLEKVPPKNFNMDVYADAPEEATDRPICATSACALGWATTIPEFGLDLVQSAGMFVLVREIATGDYESAMWYGVSRRAFDLSVDEAKAIFYSDWNATPKQKAKQIRRMVATA
jgi:hypothetical protein